MTGASSGLDGHSNVMTGTVDAIALYDTAIDLLLRFHPDVVNQSAALSGCEPPVPMACALEAYLQLMSTDADDVAGAKASWQQMSSLALNARETAHAAAIGAWLAGDWAGAAAQLDELLVSWPTDPLALIIGHQLDFFLGDAQNLRDRPLRSLREYDPAHPHADFVRGMAAFGLEEAGQYGQALDVGLGAVEANPDDVWAIHAVTHTYEMQGRIDEGIEFLGSERTRWKTGNMFTAHNWWHLALYHLEGEQPDRSLAIYDSEIHNANSSGVPIEMLDASALLWRLRLEDVDTGERFPALAHAWASKAAGAPWYVFNDLHTTMAFVGAGQRDEAREFIRSRERWLETATGTNAAMSAEIGLPALRAVLAFAEDRHDDVISELYPIRRVFNHFGGSHAQRDALQRTLLESAIRSGRYELGRALIGERLGSRESSVYGWRQRARTLRGMGDRAGESAADEQAKAHSARFKVA